MYTHGCVVPRETEIISELTNIKFGNIKTDPISQVIGNEGRTSKYPDNINLQRNHWGIED